MTTEPETNPVCPTCGGSGDNAVVHAALVCGTCEGTGTGSQWLPRFTARFAREIGPCRWKLFIDPDENPRSARSIAAASDAPVGWPVDG